jgi:hypothetical protein
VDLKKPKPTSETLGPRIEEEEDADIYPEEEETQKVLAPVLEENVEIVEDSPVSSPKSIASAGASPRIQYCTKIY